MIEAIIKKGWKTHLALVVNKSLMDTGLKDEYSQISIQGKVMLFVLIGRWEKKRDKGLDGVSGKIRKVKID